MTAPELQNRFLDAHRVRISADTVRRRLRETDLTPHPPAIGPLLTAAHKRARLQFAHDHANWMERDWARVLFSDESKFCLYNNDRRVRVYRRPGERYAQCNILSRVSYGGGSVMVWGGISLQARTELVVF